VLFAVVLALIAHDAAQAALYVSPQGSDSGPCTREAPCRTLQRADQVVEPGMTVDVAPGDYPATHLRRSGTRAARIRFQSSIPWSARVAGESGEAIAISGAFVDFVGFDVTGGAGVSSGIALAGSYSRAIGNHVHDIPRPCSHNGGIVAADADYRAHDMEIVGNWVHDIGAGRRDGSCSLLHGIYAAVPGVRIVNNVVARALGDGITSWHAAARLTVVNNTVIDNGGDGILIGNGGAGGTAEGNTNSYVANNVSAGNAVDPISESGTHPVYNNFVSNTYFGNVADRVDQWGTSVERGGRTDPVTFAGAAVDDYRPTSAVAGTRLGAPAIDFLGARRPPAGGTRGAYEALRAPDGPRPPGSPGTWPASSIGAPRHPTWPRDALVRAPYRAGPRGSIIVVVRLPARAMTVRAVAIAPRLGTVARAARRAATRGTIRLRLRLSRAATRALRKAEPVRLRVEVTVEAPARPAARFRRAMTLGR
jgi:hypothetical protein